MPSGRISAPSGLLRVPGGVWAVAKPRSPVVKCGVAHAKFLPGFWQTLATRKAQVLSVAKSQSLSVERRDDFIVKNSEDFQSRKVYL